MQREDFTARVRACERRLYRVARTILSCDADCEDAVQEALLRAWSKLDTLREERFFETWLIRILINECRRLARRRPATAELTEDVRAEEPSNEVFEALCALPQKHRIAMELHYVEGYSVREAAKLLRVPEGTVKWRLNQGRALLRRQLGEEARS